MNLFPDDPGARVAGLVAADWAAENVDFDLVSISLRVSRERLTVIDALASKAGVSRNRMANELLEVGCRDVIDRLPSEVVEQLFEESMGDE